MGALAPSRLLVARCQWDELVHGQGRHVLLLLEHQQEGWLAGRGRTGREPPASQCEWSQHPA